ncbi:MAG: hypothetical protein PWQ75_2491 [Methanolobus sp.]|uniref:hypothetical protein n=1 Tax=Methanolobus sp. TaxID=1874737 RepID=UPI00258B351B|nr:hypothetical protein [Methanolobus sp.]MDK2832739.1 hypothetical protein [Methanolobus sp.]
MFKKKIELIIVFLVITGACTLVASADQTNDSDKYTFQNYGGEVYTPEPMEFGANMNGTESVTLRNGTERKHVLIQFYDNPTDKQYEMLPNYGIEYLTSVAPYTLIISMPADITAADLPAESGLRWMGEIPVENKYQYYGTNVPYYAKLEDGNVKLAIHFYEDVTSQDSENIVKKYSDNFSAPSNLRPWYYETITNETNISLIVKEDAVQQIGYYGVEVVPESENDFADYEEIIEEDEPDIADEQENNSQETVENINNSEEKESPGFTATIAIMVLALISILVKRK